MPKLRKNNGSINGGGIILFRKEPVISCISGVLINVLKARTPWKARAARKRFAKGQTLNFITYPREHNKKIKEPA
jgi:hypothetical protein